MARRRKDQELPLSDQERDLKDKSLSSMAMGRPPTLEEAEADLLATSVALRDMKVQQWRAAIRLSSAREEEEAAVFNKREVDRKAADAEVAFSSAANDVARLSNPAG